MAKGKALLKPPKRIQAQVQQSQVGQRIPKLRGVQNSCLSDSNNKKFELFFVWLSNPYVHGIFLHFPFALLKTVAIMGFWGFLFVETCHYKAFFPCTYRLAESRINLEDLIL